MLRGYNNKNIHCSDVEQSVGFGKKVWLPTLNVKGKLREFSSQESTILLLRLSNFRILFFPSSGPKILHNISIYSIRNRK